MNIARNPTGCTIASPIRALAPRDSLSFTAITGAQPRRIFERSTFFETGDIHGAQPKAALGLRTGHYDVLSLDDIEGARPHSLDLKSARVLNPLNPQYKLPSAPPVSFPELPFKRDSYTVDDIEGTKAVAGPRWKMRDTTNAIDVSA